MTTTPASISPDLPTRCPECGGGGFVIVTDPEGEQTVRCCRCDWRQLIGEPEQ